MRKKYNGFEEKQERFKNDRVPEFRYPVQVYLPFISIFPLEVFKSNNTLLSLISDQQMLL